MLASMEQQSASGSGDDAWLVLAELNHRVGNEFQAALSALRIAKRALDTDGPAGVIDEAVLRLEAFGCVHQILDRQRGHGPLAQRLEALCRATSLAKAGPLGIRLVLKLEDVTTDEETAWTICVVASELMTNAFKHAFAGGPPGMVGVWLRQDDGGVLLTVTDDGFGADAGRRSAETIWAAPGFGTSIVSQLAARLGGFVTRVSGPTGTTATFRAPSTRGAL